MSFSAPVYDKKIISERLKSLLSSRLKAYNEAHPDDKRLTQKDYITNVLGLNSERVRSYTKGDHSNVIPLDVACDLCSKLGCTINYLLGEEDISDESCISEMTGLSEDSVDRLIKANNLNRSADNISDRINELYDKIADSDDESLLSDLYDEISDLEEQMSETDILPTIIDRIVRMPSFPYIVSEYLNSFEPSIISAGKKYSFQNSSKEIFSSNSLTVSTDSDKSSVYVTGFGKEFYVNNNILINSEIIKQALIKKMQQDLDQELKNVRDKSLKTLFSEEM